MNEVNKFEYMDNEFYNGIKDILEQARKRVYRNIQSEMLLAYWEIGKMIVEKQGGEERAQYGDGLIKELALQMTKDFGKGFKEDNFMENETILFVFPKTRRSEPRIELDAL